jgi:hypothetical protein
MRVALRITILAALVLLGAGTAWAQKTYSAVLTGSQETPPNASTAGGGGAFSLDPITHMLGFTITYGGFTETAAHIHGPAAVGQPAGVLFTLPAGTIKFGTIGPLTPTQETQLDAGLWYVNVHSATFQNGEIRGQIIDITAVQPSTWSSVKALYAH